MQRCAEPRCQRRLEIKEQFIQSIPRSSSLKARYRVMSGCHPWIGSLSEVTAGNHSSSEDFSDFAAEEINQYFYVKSIEAE